MSCVCVDVLGATSSTHDGLTGVPGSFDAACRGIKSLVGVGIPVFMTCILTRQNVPEIQEYLTLASWLRAKKVGFLRLYPLGRAKHRWSELALSLDEMMTALMSLRVPEDIRVMQSWHPNDGNCCWQNATINAFGDLIGCPYLREYVNYGNVLRTPFLDTWEHPLYRQLRAGRVTDSCADCAATQRTLGRVPLHRLRISSPLGCS